MSKNIIIAASAVVALSGSALAAEMGRTMDSMSAANLGARGITNTIINVNVDGVESIDGISSPSNTVLLVDLAAALGLSAGSQVTMTSIGWDVTISTVGDSWLSEARLYFDDAVAPDQSGLFLTPGIGQNAPGSMSFSSGGQIDLSDNMIPNIVLPNGILRIEFYESFNDVPGVADAIWGGALFVGVTEVPTPGAAALLGVAGLAGMRRRR